MNEYEEEAAWSLRVAFPDGSPSFAHGFAAGKIWEAMRRSDPVIETMSLPENKEIIERMARAEGYDLSWTVLNEDWFEVVLTKSRPSKESDPIADGRLRVSREADIPWKSSDVSGKTRKAKSAVARRQWVRVANGGLKRGLSEGEAIREANGVAKKRAAKKRKRK